MAFHVPEYARVTEGSLGTTVADGNNGVFELESMTTPGWQLFLLASDGEGWEHVSLHARRKYHASRCPTWHEMAWVKRLFWDAEDVVIQIHPRESEYVNAHPAVLHLWRPIGQEIPTPPPSLVGPMPSVKVLT